MRKGKPGPLPLEKQVYRLQIGFDAEGRRLLDDLVAHNRMTAAALVRKLLLEEHRRTFTEEQRRNAKPQARQGDGQARTR